MNECKNAHGCTAPQASSPIDCSNAIASAPLLNAQFGFLPEQIVGVTDTNGNFSVAITSITQDKPLAGGQGLCQDAFTVGHTAFLRSGPESTGGLVYDLGFTATDSASGDSCSGNVDVCVPAASQTACVDTGNDFNATQCATPPLGVTRQ